MNDLSREATRQCGGQESNPRPADTLCLIFSCLDTIHKRVGRTDRQTDTDRQQRPRLFTL